MDIFLPPEEFLINCDPNLLRYSLLVDSTLLVRFARVALLPLRPLPPDCPFALPLRDMPLPSILPERFGGHFNRGLAV